MTDLGHHPFVVIGGGLVGAAVALGAAEAGVPPLVLDEFDPSPRASRANFALVWVQGKGLGAPAYARWTRRAAAMWPELAALLAERTGIDVGLAQPGGLTFFLDAAERDRTRAELEAIARETGGEAAPFEILDAAATRALVPAIGPEVIGAAFSPEDGHVNSLRLWRALHAAIAAQGGACRAGHPVTAIEAGPRGPIVSGPWGRVSADRLVIAAGTRTEDLAAMAGLAVPMARSKGQVIVTEKCRPFFAHAGATIRQTDEGSVMIGDSEDRESGSELTDEHVSAVMAARAVRTFPLLASVGVVRSWAGFRVKPRDGLPVYASAPMAGVHAVACHSGVTLAAVHALDVARRLLDGDFGDDLACFSAGRFACSVA